MIVIDSSALAKYLLREEGWRGVEKYLLKPTYSIDHIVKEVSNAIWKHAIVHGYISKDMALNVYSLLKRLIEEEIIVLETQEKYIDKAIEIALDNKITVYDALYIAQAINYDELVTSDKVQAIVAEKYGISVNIV